MFQHCRFYYEGPQVNDGRDRVARPHPLTDHRLHLIYCSGKGREHGRALDAPAAEACDVCSHHLQV